MKKNKICSLMQNYINLTLILNYLFFSESCEFFESVLLSAVKASFIAYENIFVISSSSVLSFTCKLSD